MLSGAAIADFYAGLEPVSPGIESISVCYGNKTTIFPNDGEWPHCLNLCVLYHLAGVLALLGHDTAGKDKYEQLMQYSCLESLMEVAAASNFSNPTFRAAILTRLAFVIAPELATNLSVESIKINL